MGMEVKMQLGIAFPHLTEKLYHLQRIEHSQCIRKHESPYAGILQSINQQVHIFRTILHATAPVLQIEIDGDSFLFGIVYRRLDVRDMLFRCFLQLMQTVLFRSLCQQIDYLSTAIADPVNGRISIHESQYLYPIQFTYLPGIAAYHFHRILLSFRDTRRSHLYPVHIHILQQLACYHQFFVWQE